MHVVQSLKWNDLLTPVAAKVPPTVVSLVTSRVLAAVTAALAVIAATLMSPVVVKVPSMVTPSAASPTRSCFVLTPMELALISTSSTLTYPVVEVMAREVAPE